MREGGNPGRSSRRAREGKACLAAQGSHNLSETLVTRESIGDTNLIVKNALIVEIKRIPEDFMQHDKPEKPD